MTGDDRLSPLVRAMLQRSRANIGTPIDASKIAENRARFSAGMKDRTIAPGVRAEDIDIDGVPVRLYRPAREGKLPLHLYCHGGGFVIGSALSGEMDGLLSRRAAAAECLVASVEYRLAPEHRFPAGVEDCYRALTRLVARADAVGAVQEVVSVGGASSGGNFAAVLAIMAKDRGGPKLVLQLLEIAGADLTKSSHAWRYPAPEHDTTRKRDLAMLDLYIDRCDRAHRYGSPLFVPDLEGLPPAYVMNAEFDPRRDECEAYAARLADAGVEVVAWLGEGHIHGSMMVPGYEPAEHWQQHADAVLAAANRAALKGEAVTLPRYSA
ncbi:MAG TPA: alpha/beta hydrolase [Rhizomicrobium sp.]|nr:alpha/beta hydrolase [Rhizomicrobium sp.]